MSNIPKTPPAGRKFPCVGCGARLDFNPSARSMKCPYCGHAESVGQGQREVSERNLEEYLAREAGAGAVTGLAQEVKCGTCAAVVMLPDRVAADRCPYCAAFLQNAAPSRPLVAPEGVLPFAVDRRRALEAFGPWLRSLWFAPRALRKADLGRLQGLYVPFWTFDAMTFTWYVGERGDDYQDTEYYTATETVTVDGETRQREVTRSRPVTRTQWTAVSGEVQHFFDDLVVCASDTLPAYFVGFVTPAEFTGLQPFTEEFLTGFVTERYAVGPRDAYVKAREIMDHAVERLCLSQIGGNHQRLHHRETQHTGVTFKHILLPVWLASYDYRGHTYRVVVNGLTGEVTGDRPYSWLTITSLVVSILLAIAAIVAVIMLLVR